MQERAVSVIDGAGLVFSLNDTLPHETPDEGTNPGFTPGSGEASGRLTPKLSPHTQKKYVTQFWMLCNGLSLSSKSPS